MSCSLSNSPGNITSAKARPQSPQIRRCAGEAFGYSRSVWDASPEQREWVFPNKVGAAAHYTTFWASVWQPLLAKAGLTYRSYHSTRHTFATWLLSDGADLRWVSQQLGHASVALTAGVYGHLQPERHESAAAGLDRYLTT